MRPIYLARLYKTRPALLPGRALGRLLDRHRRRDHSTFHGLHEVLVGAANGLDHDCAVAVRLGQELGRRAAFDLEDD